MYVYVYHVWIFIFLKPYIYTYIYIYIYIYYVPCIDEEHQLFIDDALINTTRFSCLKNNLYRGCVDDVAMKIAICRGLRIAMFDCPIIWDIGRHKHIMGILCDIFKGLFHGIRKQSCDMQV